MGFKFAPQFIGLTREPSPKGKHRANGLGMALEAGKERASKSNTLDRSLSGLNEYEGFASGYDCWNAICEEADEYKITGKTKNGKDFSRSLRQDAVIGFALVIQPPCYLCAQWTDEQIVQFCEDVWECMCEIKPRIFRDENVRMKAWHHDEGVTHNGKERHPHIFGVCKDENGKFCGNEIDTMLYKTVNARLPQMMRDRGWDMEDMDLTDWERYSTDEAYREERKAKRQQQGRSVNQFINSARAETLRQAQADAETIRSGAKADAEQMIYDATYEKAEIIANAKHEAEEIKSNTLAIAHAFTEKVKADAKEKAEQEAEQIKTDAQEGVKAYKAIAARRTTDAFKRFTEKNAGKVISDTLNRKKDEKGAFTTLIQARLAEHMLKVEDDDDDNPDAPDASGGSMPVSANDLLNNFG